MIQEVFEAFLADPVKRIDAGDLTWAVKPNHAGHFHFRAAVRSDHATDIFVEGSWNPKKEKVNFTIWQTPGAPAGVRGAGKRLYSLDVGPRHRKPDGTLSARTHRHRWDAALAGKPKPGDRGRYRGRRGDL